jgi:hypothetical protein
MAVETDKGADKCHFHISVLDVITTYTFKTRTSASCVIVRFCLDKGDVFQTELTKLFETVSMTIPQISLPRSFHSIFVK